MTKDYFEEISKACPWKRVRSNGEAFCATISHEKPNNCLRKHCAPLYMSVLLLTIYQEKEE